MRGTQYPVITSGNFRTEGGKFYARLENGDWQHLEMYLPAATGTYRESFRDTAVRFLADLNSGKRCPRRGAKIEFTQGDDFADLI